MKEKVEDSTIQHLNWSKWILSLAVVAVLLLGMSGCGNQGPSLKGALGDVRGRRSKSDGTGIWSG